MIKIRSKTSKEKRSASPRRPSVSVSWQNDLSPIRSIASPAPNESEWS